ncbi:hypothetical protein LTR10_012123 [Elasticomyces elasticus]|nr:hypothetical protein LTR10_012123 [Elasticomyces elasticus]KAK4969063.1 hypothetical protein LTR42_009342 [Elasticomyces elasticus]
MKIAFELVHLDRPVPQPDWEGTVANFWSTLCINPHTIITVEMNEKTSSSKPEAQFKGSCVCGRMTYECSEIPNSVSACHCTSCRKLSGGPYQAFADVKSSSVTYYDNTEQLRYEGLPRDDIGGISFLRLSKIAERAFCADCHTPLAFRYKPLYEDTGIAMGSIDESSLHSQQMKDALKLKSHIFAKEKAGWVDIEKDGIPIYKGFSETFEATLNAGSGKQG